MNTNAKSEIFQTHISLSAHVQAETFRRYQSQGSKAKQVYFNTLAVLVANSYLNLIGWSTNLSQSDSWNPVFQTLMNVADLQIPSYGKLECRAVLSGESKVIVPPEVWSGRICYLIVMLDQDLKTGTILGFAEQINQIELPLGHIAPLSEFSSYLSQQKRIEPIATANLSKWMTGELDHGWQRLDEVFAPPAAMNFRSKLELVQLPSSLGLESRVKLVKLGIKREYTIALVVNIQPLDQNEFNVSVKVSNYLSDNYLPEGLELVIVDQASRAVMAAQANKMETIEFCFSAELEENFTVEIALEEQFLVEHFTI